jgi:hypothetical protein
VISVDIIYDARERVLGDDDARVLHGDGVWACVAQYWLGRSASLCRRQ